MSAPAWTKGPWHVDVSNRGRSVRVRADLNTVAMVTAGIHRQDNARLIAAAPELYEALEQVLGAFDDIQSAYRHTHKPRSRVSLDDADAGMALESQANDAIEMARAALAKARAAQ